MKAVEALTLVAGRVSDEILLRNEYLAAENAILRSKLGARVELTAAERIRLAKIGKKLGRRALEGVSAIVTPETVLRWYRQLIAKKWTTCEQRRPGRPRVCPTIERLVVTFAQENPSWGYDRIAGALANLGHEISDQSVGNILKRHGIPPAHQRTGGMAWADFIKSHAEVIAACDFFTAEVLTPSGLITLYVLFFVKHGNRDVHIAGVTQHPDGEWMKRIARDVTMDGWGFLDGQRFLIHDRDSKFCAAFSSMLKSGGVEPLKLPPRSPNLNAYAERWVLSCKTECLSKLVVFGEDGLRRALREYVGHYRRERNHQGVANRLLFPTCGHVANDEPATEVGRSERLGGLLKYYHRRVS